MVMSKREAIGIRRTWNTGSLVLREQGTQFMERHGEIFGDHFRIGEDGHEIRISVPTRDNVKVDMLIDTGSRRTPEVRAQIEAIGMREFGQALHHALRKKHDLKNFVLAQIKKRGGVPVGDDHEMPAIVREEVHDDVGVRSAKDDEMAVIVVIPVCCAKHANAGGVGRPHERFNIFGSPGGKQSVHVQEMPDRW